MNLQKISFVLLLSLFPIVGTAQKYLSKKAPDITKQWEGHSFSSTQSFVDNISNAPEFSILSSVLKDKALRATLNKPEMVTIFAISDKGFSKINKQKKDSIMGSKKVIRSIMRFMTVPGRVDKKVLQVAVEKHGGSAYLATLEGEEIEVMQKEGQLYLRDTEGRTAAITATNFYHKRGLFHIVDGVVFPVSHE